jgi:hypothetical protein
LYRNSPARLIFVQAIAISIHNENVLGNQIDELPEFCFVLFEFPLRNLRRRDISHCAYEFEIFGIVGTPVGDDMQVFDALVRHQ